MRTGPSLYLDVVATAAGRREIVKKERNPM